MTVGFCGDLKFGRTVHSLIEALSRYTGINIVLVSPDELTLPGYIKRDVLERNSIRYTETTDLSAVMPELDVLYMTRVQKERFFNEKSDLSVLHPLPRVNEISVAVDSDSRACYFKQVENGKLMRMALIMMLLEVM